MQSYFFPASKICLCDQQFLTCICARAVVLTVSLKRLSYNFFAACVEENAKLKEQKEKNAFQLKKRRNRVKSKNIQTGIAPWDSSSSAKAYLSISESDHEYEGKRLNKFKGKNKDI